MEGLRGCNLSYVEVVVLREWDKSDGSLCNVDDKNKIVLLI